MKKTFPKFKKKLSQFLTDESGKITKKDALGLSAAAAVLAGLEVADAHVWTSTHTHSLWFTCGSPSVNISRTINGHFSWNQWGTAVATCNTNPYSPGAVTKTASCNPVVWHSSWIVNWHYNTASNASALRPAVSSYNKVGHCSHGSHGSHGSHWSHGSHVFPTIHA